MMFYKIIILVSTMFLVFGCASTPEYKVGYSSENAIRIVVTFQSLNFTYLTPEVREMAMEHCQKYGKAAVYRGKQNPADGMDGMIGYRYGYLDFTCEALPATLDQ